MSMADLKLAAGIINANRGRGLFAGPRDSALIAMAENALGGELPPTYREFVRRLGAGNFGSFEVYGVVDDHFENSAVPDGVWVTLKSRREADLPNDLVVIGTTGDGAYYCLKLHEGQGESPVIIYQPGVPAERQSPEVVAQDFGEFFLSHVRGQL